MKNLFKVLAIITLVALIGIYFIACDSYYQLGSTGNNGSTGGTGSTGGGSSGTSPTITIKNDTGYAIYSYYIKPSTATSWTTIFSSIWSIDSFPNGTSRTYTLSQSLSTNNVYDIRLCQSVSGGGSNFIKYRVTVSNGMIVTFTASDLNDGSNLPRITIQNRTGVEFDSVHIKPKDSTVWGTSFGVVYNNNDLSLTIPIPPSSYTVFDIQLRSSNPANTYTKNNVTVSDGMVLTFTSDDSDMPLTSNPIIVIDNKTGYSIYSYYIKPSTATSWTTISSSIWSIDSFPNGTSRTYTLSQSLSANNVYDIRLCQSVSGGGSNFIKYNVTVSNGMIVTINASDLYVQ